MGQIGITEILLVVFAVVLLFGVKRLPEIGSSLGKAIREFKKASRDVEGEIKDAVSDQQKKS